jgi:hypothetical protein
LLPAGGAAVAVVAVVVVAVVVSGSDSSPSSPSTHPNTNSNTSYRQGTSGGTYTGQGQNIQRLTFTVDPAGTVTNFHGTYAVSCASTGGSSYQLQTFVDPDPMKVGPDGRFSDNYQFAVGTGAHATLTVDGTINGTTATGHLQFAEPYCGTPLDAWSAGRAG